MLNEKCNRKNSKKAEQILAMVSSFLGPDVVQIIFRGVAKGENESQIIQDALRAMRRRQKRIEKKIVEDLNVLGGIPRKEKGDPFKLAKGLLDMSREKYDELFGED